MGRDVFDAVQNIPVFIAENNVAVLAHQFQDQNFSAGIPHFV